MQAHHSAVKSLSRVQAHHSALKSLSRVQAHHSALKSLSRVWLSATPWIAKLQDSLSFTISQNLLKLKSTKSVMFIILEVLWTLTEDNKEFVLL